jgi:hypothetical protein
MKVSELLNEGTVVDAVLDKMVAAARTNLELAVSKRDMRALFIGGDSPNMRGLLNKLVDKGYDESATSYEENAEFFKKLDLKKSEYNILVKASL